MSLIEYLLIATVLLLGVIAFNTMSQSLRSQIAVVARHVVVVTAGTLAFWLFIVYAIQPS